MGATQRTMKAANNGGSAVRLMSRKSPSRLQHDSLPTVRRCVTPPAVSDWQKSVVFCQFKAETLQLAGVTQWVSSGLPVSTHIVTSSRTHHLSILCFMDSELLDTELIRETATWCFKRCVEPPFVGTEQLTPDCLRGIDEAERFRNLSSASAVEAVKEVAVLRRREIRGLSKPIFSEKDYVELLDFTSCLCVGRPFRLGLSTTPRKSDCDSAKELSRGFFDASGLPVWDSWTYARIDKVYGPVLYGWVPNEATPHVGNGLGSFKNILAEWI